MNTSKEQIHIVTTIDNNYTQHLGVMLCSLFENNLKCNFKIHLAVNFNEDKEIRKIRRLVSKYNHQLEIIKINDDLLRHCKLTGHVTLATYYRLIIPNIIDQTLTKILYLDADIIVKKEIHDLWDVSLHNNIVAAVNEPFFDRHNTLGIPITAKYFNAGVMLINLVEWRKGDISAKAIQFIEHNYEKILFWDQDVLNFLLHSKWLPLNQTWNVGTALFTTAADNLIARGELQEGLYQPAIIHYTGSSKPWHYLNDHPLKKEYYKYLRLTSWKNFKHREETVWHKIKQSAKQLLNLIFGKEKFEVYN